ncbi:hypothetical protein [Flagellimonas pelagia]|uniref:Uncharacterized protein n=1 Tax=Flagellimonas pelagia TaxID=2306998 RepID=A0A3A1NRR7_9FLAO|nr:hypothetical protein [Allomuricauda maritima]RIV47529.1 hypothetical protein D2V05_00050 [Allomuricauda maritima]TXK01618.1 hypothetical protein FQ017_00045 [Allomuricauda maritima]
MKKTVLILVGILIGALITYLITMNYTPSNEESIQKIEEDDVEIKIDENFKSVFEPQSSTLIKIDEADYDMDKFTEQLKNLELSNAAIKKEDIDYLVPADCWEDRPKSIEDLTDGVLIDAYSFEKGDEGKLGLLGFFGVELSKKQKVIVVEYSQEGTQRCDGENYKYGVGARLMMKVTKSKRNAKLNTPQQITASAIFGRAEVTYSLKTFGITGPGVAGLSKSGGLSEDTYQEFLQDISNLIIEMYKDESQFIVDPKPLPIKNL